jgi:hypothetical protein
MKGLLALLFTAAATFAQYKAETGGAAPAAVPENVRKLLDAQSIKIVADGGAVFCELWLRSSLPPAGKSTEENITLPELPHGAILGVIHFPANASDRRGQAIKAGTYTLRYSQFPITGDHQGVAPQRDFLILGPADDTNPVDALAFDPLMVFSRKASGTTHPLVLSIWKADQPHPGFAKEGEHDWVYQKKIGSIPFAIILIGKAEG